MQILIRISIGLVALLVAVSAGSSPAQLLYLDEQFGSSQTTHVFATKPINDPPGTVDLELELFEPTGAGVPTSRPAIILIHGGGFFTGDRFEGPLIQMCDSMASRGWSCVSIDYRLAGDDPIVDPLFTPVEDLAAAAGGGPIATALAAASEDGWAAYEWLVANAGTLGVDPDRIAVGGSSAGGTVAMFLAYILDDLGLAPANSFGAVFEMWAGFPEDLTYITATDAPLLLTHGDADTVIPVSVAYNLENRATEVGLAYESHIIAGADHGYDIFTEVVSPSSDTIFDRFVSFFYQHVAYENLPGCGAAPRAACRTAAKSVLVYGDQANDEKDRVTYKWIKGQATSQAQFGNPEDATQYDLCIYAGTAANLISETNVGPDALKWDALGTKGFKYKDKLLTASGTQRIVLKGSNSAKSKIVWKGKGSGLPDLSPGALPLAPGAFPILVQVSASDTSTCFETSFDPADVVISRADRIKLKQK